MTVREILGPQGRLTVDDGGAGDEVPLLFVHCDCGTHEQWRHALDHVRAMRPAPADARRRLPRRAAAFDLRGHGSSDPAANGDYSFAGRAEDIGAVLDALQLDRAILVGHSGGGITALHFAAQHPDRVVGLFLIDPPGDGRQFPADQRDAMLALLRSPAWSQTMLDYYRSIAGPNEAVRARVLDDAARTPQATVIGTFTALGSYDPMPALRGYRGPRLSLISEMGEQPAALHHLDSTLPHEVIRGTGHWVHLDEPERVLDRLEAFVADLS